MTPRIPMVLEPATPKKFHAMSFAPMISAPDANLRPENPAFFIFPASYGQRRLWFNDQRNPGRALYNIPDAIRAIGSLDLGLFRRSVHDVVQRHESLRTHFATTNGEPQQVVATHLDFDVPLVDLAWLPEKQREETVRKLVQDEINAPFNLQAAPLWRVKLFRLQEQDHVLVVVMHHIISDGWSMGVMLSEVSILYTAYAAGKPSPLPELPIQYADFSAWESEMMQSRAGQESLNYWIQRLSGTPALLLPYDRPKQTPPPGKGATYVLKVEKELAERLRRLAQERNATLYMILLAAYQTLLYRYTGQQDIAVGSNIARRRRTELERQIGYFANNVIIRTKLSEDWSFYEMLASVRDAALGAYTHQDMPLDRVAQELAAERDPKRPLIFHVTFTLQNLPHSEFRLGNMELRPFEVQISPAKHDISVFVTDTGGPILFGALYNMDLFNAGTIATFFEHYSFLLQSIVEHPALPLSRLALCSGWKEGSGMPAGCRVHSHDAAG
jgi:hypothetical protein